MTEAERGADGPERREQALAAREARLLEREGVLHAMDLALKERAGRIAAMEVELGEREQAALDRELAAEAIATGWDEFEEKNSNLRQVNENLVLLTLEAQELRDAAQAARHRQEEFLAMLAHELRNPLGPIRTAVEVLARLKDGQAAPASVLNIIRRQVQHMVRLIDDLLDLSRVTQGKISLHRQPTAVREFVERAVDGTRELFAQRKQHLEVQLPEPPLYVAGDAVRLVQVLVNLLQNASKYTPAAGAISVRVERLDGAAVLRVKDNGIGISARTLPHVFDLFVQGERAIDRSQGGLGIGLTIVKRLVELHGGTVKAISSGRGKGSEFVVTLPQLLQADMWEPKQQAAAAAWTPRTARILVIEDNEEAGSTLAEFLRLAGHEVEVALDGPSGLRVLPAFKPDVVLCDIGLPGMDGYEVAARIQDLPLARPPALIALTGYGSAADVARARAAGFAHQVVKPADPNALLQLIDAQLR